jgi:hypothetical protein
MKRVIYKELIMPDRLFGNYTIKTVDYDVVFQIGEDGNTYIFIQKKKTGTIILSQILDNIELWELAKTAIRQDPRQTPPVVRRKQEVLAADMTRIKQNQSNSKERS